MPDVDIFSNKPKFCNNPATINETLNMQHFDMVLQANPATSSFARCGDPLLGTTLQKHIVHDYIKCGGEDIDINFMMDMYPATDPTKVSASTWYNRYKCDPDFNIYVANTVTGTAPGAPIIFNMSKSNHMGGGTLSMASEGLQFLDKDNMIWYTITDVNTTVNYGHRITIVPNDATVTASVRVNKQYLILPFRMVGGCACPIYTTSLSPLGYAQALKPVKIRRDWRLCIEVLKGKPDDVRYGVIFDMNGNPVDSYTLQQEQDMRIGLRMAVNMLAFMGSPTTNTTLLSGVDATIDATYTGFYGLIPTIQYGGGKVYNIRRDQGFDFETDFEPIMLYQGSRKLSRDFTALHGMKFRFDINDKSNKLVLRTGAGINDYDAFRRKDLDESGASWLQKLGIKGYDYEGFSVNLKEMKSWSDYRFMGSDRWNSTALFMPHKGVTEDGKRIPPIEFYNYGNGPWDGSYEEEFRDERKINGCEYLAGYGTQALGMGVHCPDQWILVNPIDPT